MATDIKILLVDDEPLERQAIRFLLARERPHYQIAGEAGNGGEAVKLAARLRPDIVFLDIKMPVMDGLTAGREIRAILPEARLIFVTAYGEFDYTREAVALGASKYLLKPVAAEEMLPLLDELAAGVAAARRRQQETARLRAALEEAKPFIRLGFIMDLINGNITDAEAVSRARFLGIATLPRLAMLVDIDNFAALAREGTEVERQILKQQVKESLERATVSWPGALVAPVTRDEFAILLPLDHLAPGADSHQAAIELGEGICRQVRRDTRATVTVGIGRPVAKVAELARSYAEAVAAAEFRLFYGGDQVIHADDVIARPSAGQFLPAPEEQELTQAIRMGDRQAAYRQAKNILMQLLLEQEKRPAILKMKLLELNTLAARAALEGGADPEAVSDLALASSTEFLTLDNLADMRERILERLMALVAQVAETREQRNSSLIDRASKYIEANFSQDLTLEEVARQVYLSPCYFSKLFKQFKGLNFIDYLTKVRLKAARELLLNTKLPVAEIATRVGYRDARYFGQVFKKQEGYTPSVFRKIGGAHFGKSTS
ncbi:HTH-type transcriptional regulator YesS [Moorella thermoacetica]|uniref:response regulator transcription factor n=1 Tax=Neomoorella thermoacetica TaxID=1525 RepID=UPI00069EB15D|nr:response regulator [Moorella thermoacetica]AKX94950.1 HTH-type transcriptional regulator YesS [Moorella thermoacetica]